MKIFVSILFICSFLNSQSEATVYPITAVDPKNTRDYPGGRGEHQLIIYSSAYGKKTTGTNQWGVEATVKENIVVAVGGNNSPIKEEEIILSGHGKARLFLQRTVKVGAKIVLTDTSVTVSFDSESFKIYATMRLNGLVNKFEKLKTQLTEAERTLCRNAMDSLQKLRDETGIHLDSTLYVRGMQMLDEVEYRISLSKSTEGRGVWHRPVEKNPDEIAAVVQKFAGAGFNMIFLETIWRGETIYPGFITQQKKEFLGFDPLRIYITEGKKHGIEIHAWIHTFFVGYLGTGDDTSAGPILTAHPDWQLMKRNGEKVSKAEPGYLFVNPAHPDAQEYIASLYREVRSNYPELGGIQMDYIRYPVNVPLEESSDYGDVSRKKFKDLSGVDPIGINPADNPEQWELWRSWREQQVTNFVKKIRWENPEVLLSADIFPDIEEAQKTKMQNWGEWAQKGYVNFLAPMLYTVNSEWVTEAIGKMRGVVGEQFPLFIGLAPYLALSPSQLLQQIEMSRESKVSGVILFSSSSITDEQLHLLAVGPFRNKALVPALINKSIKP